MAQLVVESSDGSRTRGKGSAAISLFCLGVLEWFIRVAAGPHKDLNPSLSASGDLSGQLPFDSFESQLGWSVQIGILRQAMAHFGYTFGLQYTSQKYRLAQKTFDASSFGLYVGFFGL